ncbi:ParA family protein [Enterococcus cecorum]|uniref:ParA family protein n=1 Tax=Enterococcus cecorum TaxID=44008 RepID=UPI00148B4715|nr:ParA family protein [Enterococcus cecorum]MCJ0566998.1 ParA family protein [Enterococcus cecorum]
MCNQEKTGKVISIINMKGGVGKTTLTIGLATYLAEKANKKILVIDGDPQSNATQSLLNYYSQKPILKKNYNEIYKKWQHDKENEDESDDFDIYFYNKYVLEEKKNIVSLFPEPKVLTQSYEDVAPKEIVIDIGNNISLISGNLALVYTQGKTNKKIRSFINKHSLKKEFDYILIDCPPTLTSYTDACLIASDYYLIPTNLEYYSGIGVSSLLNVIDQLVSDEDLKLQCLGIVYSRIEKNLPKKTQKIKQLFENKISENGRLDILNSVMYKVNHLENGAKGNIAIEYAESNRSIAAIAQEVLYLIGGSGDE